MGTIIVVFAAAVSAAAVTARPTFKPTRPVAPARSSISGVVSRETDGRLQGALARAHRDFERRQRDLGLVGSSPLFGAEGLPKPRLSR
jgi:hypothetical protein